MPNGYDQPEHSSGRYHGRDIVSDHGNRIQQLEDNHRTVSDRVGAVDRRVTGIEATLSSMIAEAASSRATMTAKMDNLAMTLDNVKSTLDIDAGRRVGMVEAEARIAAEMAKAEAAKEAAEAKATSRIRTVVGFALAAVPFLTWAAVQFIEDVPRKVEATVEMTQP